MIISHKYKFIFIKTNKTAGTSIEIGLSKFCGPDDIITPISPEDEEIRRRLGYPGPQNYKNPIWKMSFKDAVDSVFKGKKRPKFYNHISAQEVIDLIGREKWDDYYTFCFERNPWDRVISQYYWVNKSEPRPEMQEFLKSTAIERLKLKGYGNYTVNGEVVVDKVCKFENLSEELDQFRTLVGLPEKIELPKAKSKYRKDKRDYHDVFSEEDRRSISELFRDEIDLMGYQW
ncbi:hypothetical protein Maes01_02064 [Microbulbifer aestuariivivens]|uniref:Chondroitin 4-O-sulfotransferase n=1 Tax=Microbulbifer aestuariivivens TaxID=1908308 RepID=A0ABP9WQV3_9GAMM